jgi:hypothetical protein
MAACSAARGGDKTGMLRLLRSVAEGRAPELTAKELMTLHDYIAGEFKGRGRGQHKSGDRNLQRARAFDLQLWLRHLRETIKDDPAEKVLKRAQRGHYNLNHRVAERAHELMQKQRLELIAKYGEGYMDAPLTRERFMDVNPVPLWDPIPSVASLMNRLKRG